MRALHLENLPVHIQHIADLCNASKREREEGGEIRSISFCPGIDIKSARDILPEAAA